MTLAEAVKALAVGPMRYPTATVLPPLPAITIQASPVTTPAKLTRAEAPPPSHDEESTALKVEKATSQPFIWEHNQEVHSISEAWGETVWFGLHELAQPSIREVAATTEPRALAPKPPSQPPQEAGDLTELPPALPPQAPPQKIEAAPQATHATEPGPRKEPELSFAPGLAPASFALISPFTLAPQPQAESEPEPEVLTPLPGVSVPHVAPPTREQIPLPPPVSLFEFTNEIAAPFPPPRSPAPPPAPQAEAVPTPVLAPDSSALAALMSALQAKSSEPASPPPIPESTVERGLFPSPFVMEPSEFEEAAPCIHESPSPLDELLSRPHPPLPHPSLQPVHFVDELLAKPVAAPGLPHPRTDGVPPRTLIEGLSRSRGQFSSPPPPDPHLKSSPEERPLPPVTRFAPLSPQTTANLDDHRPSRFRWSMAVFGTLLLLAVVAMFLHLYTGGAVWEKRRWQEWLMMEPHTPGTVEHPALPAETSPQLTQSTP